MFGDRMVVSQFTRDACPPLLEAGYENCRRSNRWVIGEIARIRPETVVLFATWTHYQVDWAVSSPAKSALLATIDALQRAGVEHVVVVGPSPIWGEALPRLLYKAWQQGTPFHVVPERLAKGFDPAVANADRAMRRELPSHGVRYVSANDALCDADGCLTRLPGGPARLVSWDHGHLTTDAAWLVARRIDAEHALP